MVFISQPFGRVFELRSLKMGLGSVKQQFMTVHEEDLNPKVVDGEFAQEGDEDYKSFSLVCDRMNISKICLKIFCSYFIMSRESCWRVLVFVLLDLLSCFFSCKGLTESFCKPFRFWAMASKKIITWKGTHVRII